MYEKMRRSNRHICTKRDPWTAKKGKFARHPDAVVTRDADDTAFSCGNKTRYHCPNCGIDFSVTEADY